MKLIHLTCPSCGSNLDVDIEGKQTFCQFCGAKLMIDDEIKHIQFDNTRQAGYEFELGRQQARREEEQKKKARQRAIKEAAEQRQKNYEKHKRIAEEQRDSRNAKYTLIGFLVFGLCVAVLHFMDSFIFVKVMLGIAAACFIGAFTSAAKKQEYHYHYTEQAEIDDDGEITKIYDEGKQVK